MTPRRAEEITLYCEDTPDGRSQRLINAALQGLRHELPFVEVVSVVGVGNKNDLQVRTKLERGRVPPPRVFGVRDRDFLTRPLVAEARQHAFDHTAQNVRSWPLGRYCIESYLLDEELLAAAPRLTRTHVEEAAATRRWFDVARGTLEDLAFRLRRIRHASPTDRPADRSEAVGAVFAAGASMLSELGGAAAEAKLEAQVDALAADMDGDGPLWTRVDGRELLYDLDAVLDLKRGALLDQLGREAQRRPPPSLVHELRAVCEAVPSTWRTVE